MGSRLTVRLNNLLSCENHTNRGYGYRAVMPTERIPVQLRISRRCTSRLIVFRQTDGLGGV